MGEKISAKNKALHMCLKIRQFDEGAVKQGKIQDHGKLSSNLSTGSVDLFGLDSTHTRLQLIDENHISRS
ncbi:MAG: hypothetical protein ACPG61_07900 [Paracoccaceae bacterium]